MLAQNRDLLLAGFVGAVLIVLTKSARNLSHEKLILKTCVDNGIPYALALLIVAQSKHETALNGVPYLSKQLLINNNAFGYGRVVGNTLQIGSGGKHPEDAGVYAKYTTLNNSVLDVIGWYKRRKSTFFGVTDITTFANNLKFSKYFTDSAANYGAGVKHYFTTNLS